MIKRHFLYVLGLTGLFAGGLCAAEKGADHWAWQPLKSPALPDGSIEGWDHPIDRYISRELVKAGIEPGQPADRATLFRRIKLDLLGLPPGYDEVQAFTTSPQTVDELVSDFLARPQYGERWGRHWLDVARYADSKGTIFGESTLYPYAYTYRDYVIRAFNEDRPYNRFLLEQIAADLLDDRKSDADLAALGFLTVGDRFGNKPHLIIDDVIDVVTRGTMALTVACSRCHDHKYDPIPISDYYSLYGVFASTREPEELPIIGKPPSEEAYQDYVKKKAELEAVRDKLIAQYGPPARKDVLNQIPHYIHRALNPNYQKQLTLRRGQVNRWKRALKNPPAELRSVLGPIAAMHEKAPNTFAKQLQDYLEKHPETNPVVAARLKDAEIIDMTSLAAVYGKLLDAAWKRGTNDSDPGWKKIRKVLIHSKGPIPQTDHDTQSIYGQLERDKVRDKTTRIKDHEAESPGAPPRAMVVKDSRIVEPVIFVRGDQNNPGEKVARQFLALLSGDDRKPFTEGSGRLELARAITAPDNPMTARTLVNRVWYWHFGEGLVRTMDNFGTLGEKPTHPDLLDYLAGAFMRHGWSIKWLHQHIMSSRTYQQASTLRPDAHLKDPENRWLWRYARRRLDYEVMRDSVLSRCRTLDLTGGGQPFQLDKEPFTPRRSVYGLVNRGNLATELPTFDFASPTASMGHRPRTTVPQQALYMLNGKFILAQAKALAGHPETRAVPAGEDRVRYLFRQVLARDPLPAELKHCMDFVSRADPAPDLYARLIQTLLSSNEFSFID